MRYLSIMMIMLFTIAIAGFGGCGDKSKSKKVQAPAVENIQPENAEQKAEEVLKEIEKL